MNMEWINPNHLTLFRIVAAPLFLSLFPIEAIWARFLCLVIVILAVVSDYLDGKLARRFKRVSLFGKFFDPLTDFLFFVTVFLAFWRAEIIPLWMVSLVLLRELAMHTGVRPYFAIKGIDPGARWSGKTKTVFQCTFTIIVCLHHLLPPGYRFSWFPVVANILFGVVVFLSWSSIFEYILSIRRTPS